MKKSIVSIVFLVTLFNLSIPSSLFGQNKGATVSKKNGSALHLEQITSDVNGLGDGLGKLYIYEEGPCCSSVTVNLDDIDYLIMLSSRFEKDQAGNECFRVTIRMKNNQEFKNWYLNDNDYWVYGYDDYGTKRMIGMFDITRIDID